MKLTKKIQKEIECLMKDYWYLYLTGNIESWSKYLVDNYHNIGGTEEEIWNSKKEILDYTNGVIDQMVDQIELRNKTIKIIPFDPYFMVHELLDMYVKIEGEWSFYGKFRLSSLIQKFKTDWKVLHQHGSFPDSKAKEGEAFAVDALKNENLKLQKAVKKRTLELEQKNRELEVETALERIRAQAVAMKESSDLLDIVVTMRNEFIKLGHEAHYFWHMMWLPETYEKAMTSGDGTKIGFVMKLPRHIHGDIPLLAKWEKSKKPTVVYTMNAEEAIDYVDKMVSLGDFKNIDPQAPSHDDIRHIGGLTFIMARTTHGEIGFSLPGIVKNPPKEDVDILVKFASAFDLAHQRFLDLQKAEKQAKETQVELSLERIRSRVAEMKTSSDLFDIVVTMRNEFMSLGHEADYFWHMKWLEDNYEMSMTAEDGSRLGMVITVPKFVHEQIESLHNWEKSNSPYFVLALNGKEAWDYIENMNTYGQYKQIDPHAPSEEDILHIGGLTFIIARTTHGEIGFSLAGEVPNPPKASIEILLRFAKVFDLAYKRFEDLKKAEAQARETQIELTLEKVRSRTMAMQHSDELQEASFLLDQQVRALGIKTWGCAFNIYGEKDSTEWFGNEKGVLPTYSVPRRGIFKDYYQKGQKGESFFIKEFSGKTCVDHYEYMSSLPVIGDVLKDLKKTNKGFPTYQIDHVAYFKYGYLLFITKEHVPDAHDVFKRFAKVFEQTYTRFLDLQKAEAQAREAKIEAALERVRAKSMAMHHTSELQDVINTVHSEFIKLNIAITGGAFISINNEINKEINCWGAGGTSNYVQRVHIPFLDRPIYTGLIAGIKKGPGLFSETYSNKEKIEFFEHLFKHPPYSESTAKKKKEVMSRTGGYSRSCIVSKNTSIFIINHHGDNFSNSENEILKRFGIVFEQTYTRFLDLQKAEAQARESQIQLCLERVRAKSMAMQSSNELETIIQVVHDQFVELDIALDHAGFIIDYKTNDDMIIWLADEHKVTPQIRLPYFESPHWNSFITAKKQGHKLFVNHLDFKTKNKFYKQIFKYVPELPEDARSFYLKIPSLTIATSLIDTIGLYIENFSGVQYEEEDQKILFRFGEEFQQAFTRFLDLQKAEAQARESQIQLSLERVRARSMAMQSSDELHEVIGVVFQQFDNLGIHPVNVFLSLFDRQKRILTYRASGKSGKRRPTKQDIDIDSVEAWSNLYNKWINDSSDDIEVIFYPKEIVPDILNLLKDTFLAMPKKDRMTTKDFPEGGYSTLGYTPFGYLGYDHTRPPTEEEKDILKRICTEFGRVYQRFLDIQKAEDQAREAQIEAALERVRSASMAMHKTEDLADVVVVYFEQLNDLQVKFIQSWITIFHLDEGFVDVWFSPLDGIYDSPTHFKMPSILFEETSIKSWKEGLPFSYISFSTKEAVDQFFQVCDDATGGNYFRNIQKKLKLEQFEMLDANHKYGCISKSNTMKVTDEEKDILQRFAKVFEQTYTRFLDLQKAEAQTREAQIEASLERIRAKSMAMHHPSELSEVLTVMFEQLDGLGVKTAWTHLTLIDLEKNTFTYRMTGREGKRVEVEQVVAIDASDVWIHAAETFKSENPDAITRLEFKPNDLPKLWDIFDGIFSSLPEGYQIYPEDFPDGLFATQANCKFGYLGINQPRKATEEEEKILGRFGNEFGRLYQRYLDIEKAQHQAREAQIEVSLERVRANSMAMHNTDELTDVLGVLFDQFEILGINPALTHLTLFDEENDTFSLRITTSGKNKVIAEQIIDVDEIEAWRNSYHNWKRSELHALDCIDYPPEQLPDLWEVLDEVMSALPKKHKIYPEDFPNGLYTTQGHCKFGYLGFNSGQRATEEEKDIVVRFAKEFGRLYQRFLDLQKAEGQAREAQIEAALERVRSRAMAIRSSIELDEVIQTIFQELEKLEMNLTECSIVAYDTNPKDLIFWSAGPIGSAQPSSVKLQYIDHPLLENLFKDFKNGIKHRSGEISGKVLETWWQRVFTETDFRNAPKEFIDSWKKVESICYSQFAMTHGFLEFLGESPLPEDKVDILNRFTNVIDLTYTRYDDVIKAEAQAREAQIQLSLERVRAKSMAMQSSDELETIIQVVHDQFVDLGITLDHAGFIIDYKTNDDMIIWLADEHKVTPQIRLPYFDSPHWNSFNKAKEKGHKLFVNHLDFKTKNKFYRQIFKYVPELPEEARNFYLKIPSLTIVTALSNTIGLYIENFSGVQYQEEDQKIISRFSDEFQQAYTRFLDLQKAEAQAREAQIESALERVRSQSMGMQTSDDFSRVTTEMFNQLRNFGEDLFATGIVFCDKHKDHVEQWHSIPGGGMLSPMIVPIDLDYIHQYRYNQWKQGTELFSIEIPSDFIEQHFEDIFKLPSAQITLKDLESRNAPMPNTPPWEIDYGASFKNGYILASSLKPLENMDILPRFANVFEQAYTRFLDLKKAEAQAREAQIEVALEKIRSRTMAMQKGEELKDVVVLLYKELIALGITNFRTCGYVEVNEETKRQHTYVTGQGGDSLGLFYLPLEGDAIFDARYSAWKKQQVVFHQTVGGKKRRKHLEYAITTFNSKEAEEMVLTQFPDPTVFYCFNFSHGYLHLVSGSYLTKEEESLLARFTRVFEQTYARFLDLEKAEAQAREAQINLAVERVRAKALAMHKSEEIIEVVAKLKDEVMSLDIPNVIAATIFLKEGENKVRMWDLSSLEKLDGVYQSPLDITFKPKKVDPHLYPKRVWENPDNYFIEIQDTKGFKRIIAWLREHNKHEVANETEAFIESTQLKQLYHAAKKLNNGKLVIDLLDPPSDEMETILTKMGAAFDLAYKRFEDLQKAEAQTREAQIEAALERVRAASMAMHKSEDLLNIVKTLYGELETLNINTDIVGIRLNKDNSKDLCFWMFTLDGLYDKLLYWPYQDLRIFHEINNSQVSGEVMEMIFSKAETKEFFREYFKLDSVPQERRATVQKMEVMSWLGSFLPNTGLFIMKYLNETYSPEERDIVKRFAKVFEQAYTRFLDLQKAEAQAREAQIENALEKVRSRSLAMHQSEELWDVINAIFQQLEALKIQTDACLINIYQDNKPKDLNFYSAAGGQTYRELVHIPYANFNVFNRLFEAREKEESFYSIMMDKKEKDRFWKYFFAKASNIKVPIKRKNYIANTTGLVQSAVLGEYASMHMMKYVMTPYTEEENKILMRFGKAFDQVYTRFLDLQKAEAQARESLISAGLERVRSRTLAMQTSDELAETSVIVFKQLLELGIAPNRLFIGIVKKDKDTIEAWTTNEDGSKLAVHFSPQASKNKSIKKMLDGWKQKKKSLVIDMKGKELQEYFHYLSEDMKIPFINGLKQKRRVQTIAYFSGGLIGMAAPEEQPEETITLLERFASVFNLTYTRFNDLKVAEAQAREAQIETALEKVRSRTMAMQNSSELPEAANNLFLQIQALGIPAWSAGYCIWENNQKSASCNMSSEGEIQKGFSLPTIGEGYDFYNPMKKGKDFHVAELGGEALVKHYDFMKTLPTVGEIFMEFDKKGIALPTFQIFHIVYFTHGYLMFITYEAVPDAHQIFKRFGQVFEQTYTRFQDLKLKEEQAVKLKEEKQRLEKTLKDLQATQTQLIQSEKMASLGELTAGIAHEIQNPLNFVNNFSEVSKELLDEMLEEIENGDMEEVKAIMDDVIQNLEKINHHGKRADGIVKGMLQHSRASGSQKEPTNINGLADEYLRLAYHGLRAKDKSFNATLETDYDDTLEKINVIPQDIGRVVLNLLTNAFYACTERSRSMVNEKKQSNQNGFEPTVKLSTKKNGNWVTISVKDNGNGIPKHVLEKIFQPFFTTKPTGQGTGLGLSMSYDIVTKGHGGELKVKTEQGIGTEFIIILPV